jgi:hypothetical protein
MSESESRTGWLMTLKLATAGLGILVGLSTFCVFTFVYGNVHAGSWALLSGIFATFVFHLHLLYKNHRLAEWHTVTSLTANRNLGILALLGSLAATSYYWYTAFSQHQPLYPIGDSYMIAGVWAFMTVKWSAGLTFFGHKYNSLLEREYTLL